MKAGRKSNRKNRSLLPKLTLILVLLATLTWAGMRAYAAWHFLAAQSITTTMVETTSVSESGINDAMNRVERALKRFPANPDYLELAAQLQDLKARQPGVVGKVYREAIKSAAKYHRQALKVRPLWPYSWAGLLRAKDGLGEIDEEFRLAMAQSVKTGPREPGVQLQVIRSGLRHWENLGAAERELVKGRSRDALTTQPRDVFEIVRSFRRPDIICEYDLEYKQIRQWCEASLATNSNLQ